MDDHKLKPKESKQLPYNYSLYPVEVIGTAGTGRKGDPLPIEFCKAYNATLFVRAPYKKIVVY